MRPESLFVIWSELAFVFLEFLLAIFVFLIVCGTIGWLISLFYRPKQTDKEDSDRSHDT